MFFFLKPGNNGTFTALLDSRGEMFVKKDEGKTQVCEVFLLLTC